MPILRNSFQKIEQIFEFAAGEKSFELIDIQSSAKDAKTSSFLDSAGSFVYRTRMIIDDKKAEQLGVTAIRLEFFNADTKKFVLTDSNLIGQHEIILETATKEKKEIVRHNKSKKISVEVQSNATLKVYAANTVATSNMDKVSLPVSAGKFNQKGLKVASETAIANGFDPAALSSVGYPFTQTAESASSLDSRNNAVALSLGRKKSVDQTASQKISLSGLRQKIRHDKRSSYKNDIVESHIPVKSTISKSVDVDIKSFDFLPAKRLVQRDIHLEKGKVGSIETIFVKISAVTRKKISGTQKLFTEAHEKINHSRLVSSLVSYAEPPEVVIERATPSAVVFMLTRTDPMLQAVRVVRIQTNPSQVDPTVTDLGTHDFGNRNVIRITNHDNNLKPSTVTFRFSAVVDESTLGEFTSVVVPTFKKVSDPIKNVAVPFSIMARNKRSGGISIKVCTRSDDVLSFRLLRQEYGKSGDFSESVVTIRNPNNHYETLITSSDTRAPEEFEFLDETAQLGHKYRYFVAYRSGKISKHSHLSIEKLSREDDIIVCRYLTENVPFILEMQTSGINFDARGRPVVTVTTTATEKEDLFPSVIDALSAAGVSGDFISNIQSNSIKAKDFIMFLIERFDTATGRRENFGIRPPGDFIDNADERSKFGVSELMPGRTYYYTAKACLQDPSVFFQKTNVALVTRLGNLIPREATRFTRKIRSSLGVLPSESQVKKGLSINDLILESQIGIEIASKVSYTQRLTRITSPQVLQKNEFTDISCQIVDANTEHISYFNVFCTLQGEKNLIGSVAANPSVGSYIFRDDTYSSAVGTKAYSVVAIDHFHEEIANSKPVRQDKLFSLPQNMLVGAAFATFGNKRKVAPIGRRKRATQNSKSLQRDTPAGVASPLQASVEIGDFDFNQTAVSTLDSSFFSADATQGNDSAEKQKLMPRTPVARPDSSLGAPDVVNRLNPEPFAKDVTGTAKRRRSKPSKVRLPSQRPALRPIVDPANQIPLDRTGNGSKPAAEKVFIPKLPNSKNKGFRF